MNRSARTCSLIAVLAVIAIWSLFPGEGKAEPYWIFFPRPDGWSVGKDIPKSYLNDIECNGAVIRSISRYFYGVSVEWAGSQNTLKEAFPDAAVTPVHSLGTRPDSLPIQPVNKVSRIASFSDHELSYGLSYDQLATLNIPYLHDRGLTGEGVTIGVLDTGFNIDNTPCLDNLNIAHTWNFLTGSTDVHGDSHGAHVIACLAGREDGTYYGPAYNATLLLAVSDDADSESRMEEDRWVAAVEWCDSLGADIITSSLVYNTFDDPGENYTIDDMDGETSLVARAASIAASRGIAMINAAGNEGKNQDWGIITTPGDCPDVLAVGAVAYPDPLVIASFSSRGPTADGRIKPDIVGPGQFVRVPFLGSNLYQSKSGTSFATPLVAGLCALLYEANPMWTPRDLYDAVKSTAIDLGTEGPDNTYGWGLPDAVSSITYHPLAVTETYDRGPETIHILSPYPNPFNAGVTLPFYLAEESHLRVDVVDIIGRHVVTLWDRETSSGSHEIRWTPSSHPSGTYLIIARTPGQSSFSRITLLK